MYHSISSKIRPAVSGSHPISMDRFKRQVDMIQRAGFELTCIRKLGKKVDDVPRAFLTSDDGTSDWGLNVLPWCETQQIPTHTSIITGPHFIQKEYPVTHVIQVILKNKNDKILTYLKEELESKISLNDLKYINKIYRYEINQIHRFIKGAFNLILNSSEAEAMIEPLIDHNLLKDLDARFMPLGDYKKYSFATIGNHTKKHTSFTGKVEEYLWEEIQPGQDFLSSFPNFIDHIFTLPLKPKFRANKFLLYKYLQEKGFKYCLTSFPGIWNGESFEVQRIDAKDVEKTLKNF